MEKLNQIFQNKQSNKDIGNEKEQRKYNTKIQGKAKENSKTCKRELS